MATLYIVATPIGNLDDFSPRAMKTLSGVDYIACEDTRTTSFLLQKFNIQKPTFSFHLHNEHTKIPYVISLLEQGYDIALVSDAGMPGISDPGFLAIRAAHQSGFTVSVIPGPSAVINALILSGLPSDRFIFEGFLPPKKGRKSRIEAFKDEERTLILYESPHRIIKLLDQLVESLGPDRMVAVTRELTKKFEEVIRGSLQTVREDLVQRDKIKGEITIVIAGKSYTE